MTQRKIIGITLFGVGCLLLAAAYHATGAPLEQLSNSLTGRYTDQTVWFLIAGFAGIVSGALLMMPARSGK